MYLYHKNNGVELTLPEDLSFRFEAVTKNGSVSTPFESVLSMKNDTVAGTVGDNLGITIRSETRNGILSTFNSVCTLNSTVLWNEDRKEKGAVGKT